MTTPFDPRLPPVPRLPNVPQKVLRPILPGMDPQPGLGPSPAARRGAPVSFTAKIDTIAQASTRVFDTAALQPGYRTPYIIDEIRMTIIHATGGIMSGNVQFLFQTGQHQFSQVPVPMALYGPEYSYFGQVELGRQGGFGDVNTKRIEHRRWLLPQPLWLGPGDVIQASVVFPTMTGVGGTIDRAIVTYVGRSVPPGAKAPPLRNIPWVAYYNHQALAIGGSQVAYSESNDQFRNKFLKPWHIHRAIGYVNCYSATTPSDVFMFDSTNISNQQLPISKMKITDSLGYQVTRDFIPMADLFAADYGAAWTFRRSIGPREQINVGVTVSDPQSSGVVVSPMASFVGYREEIP